VNAILDEAFFCHLGFNVEAQPFVIPTVHARHNRPAGGAQRCSRGTPAPGR
jgi:nitroimidazol reductase NimA-like FMN-containing flavoprotein (pyridoxamine 5'-phosphate oxidase superfamily)